MKYMQVKLAEITKPSYFKVRTNCKIEAERPLGFITTIDGVRKLFIAEGGKFYSGDLMPWQSNEMFMQMKFNEIKQFIAAQFEVPDAA